MKPLLRISDKTRMATKRDGTKIPVLDGEFDFLLQPNEEDIKNGIPGDHTSCMYCLCCKRQFNSEMVYVTRGLAYVELRGKRGRHELRRFILKDPAKKVVKAFDGGANVSPEAVIFAAPKKHERLDAKNAAYHRWAQRRKSGQPKKAYVKGTKPRDHSIKPLGETLRDPATGLFQFTSARLKTNKPF